MRCRRRPDSPSRWATPSSAPPDGSPAGARAGTFRAGPAQRRTGRGMDGEVASGPSSRCSRRRLTGQGPGLGLGPYYRSSPRRAGRSTSPPPGAERHRDPPAGEPERRRRAEQRAGAAPAGRGESVLIAEDDMAVRRVAERILDQRRLLGRSQAGRGRPSAEASTTRGATRPAAGRRRDARDAGDDLARRAVAMRPDLRPVHVRLSDTPAERPRPDDSRASLDKPFDAGALLDACSC